MSMLAQLHEPLGAKGVSRAGFGEMMGRSRSYVGRLCSYTNMDMLCKVYERASRAVPDLESPDVSRRKPVPAALDDNRCPAPHRRKAAVAQAGATRAVGMGGGPTVTRGSHERLRARGLDSIQSAHAARHRRRPDDRQARLARGWRRRVAHHAHGPHHRQGSDIVHQQIPCLVLHSARSRAGRAARHGLT